jgi:hypothetical protein
MAHIWNTHHLSIGLLKQSISKDTHHKNIDYKWTEQSNAWFNEVVIVGLSDFLRLRSVYVSWLLTKH